MFSTLAYEVNVDASAALVNITPLADPHLTPIANVYPVPAALPNLLGAFAGGALPLLAQLRAPSLRMIFQQELAQMALLIQPGSPQELEDYFENPIPLVASEGLEALVQAGVAAQENAVIVFLGDGPVAPVKGHIRTIRANSITAAGVLVWTNVPIAFAEVLPAGRYQIVGFRPESASMICARLLIPGSYWRPGALGTIAITNIQAPRFRHGNAGVWGEFDHDVPPTVDVLCELADAAQTFTFDLIKVA